MIIHINQPRRQGQLHFQAWDGQASKHKQNVWNCHGSSTSNAMHAIHIHIYIYIYVYIYYPIAFEEHLKHKQDSHTVDGINYATLWCSEALVLTPRRKRFCHETGPEKWSRADIRCTRLRMALRVFFVSTGIPGLRKIATIRIDRLLLVQSEVSQVKFGWWTTYQSNSWYYTSFLMYPHVKTNTKPNAWSYLHLF